jgi:hypothetical protein
MKPDPWEPIANWSHGRVTEKYVQGGEGLVLAARIVEHISYGVAWFVYGLDGQLVARGRADSIVMAQLQADSGKATQNTDASSRSA